ncbi:MAG: transcriptional repressor [Clostridium sp.]|nr:transcriptional repressor [Clostridium sp.]
MERYSKQRELILNVLKERNDHPTAEMLYNDIIKIMPTIGIATVYRNLAALYESGQILKIETKQGESDRFDGNLTPHLHFQCLECNEIQDIFLDDLENEQLNDKLKEFANIINAEVTSSKILLKGKCEKCKNKEI